MSKPNKSNIPSPSRSKPSITTPRRNRSHGNQTMTTPERPRNQSMGSPARPGPSKRRSVSTLVLQINSAGLSPMPSLKLASEQSFLSDNTEIDQPRRKSWWKRLERHSTDRQRVFEINDPDDEVGTEEFVMPSSQPLSQGERNDASSISIPESSDCESIPSIIIPRRTLFNRKQQKQTNVFDNINLERESGASKRKSIFINEAPKKLFSKTEHRKTDFTAVEDVTTASSNKTVNIEVKKKSLFGRKAPKPMSENIFANMIMSDDDQSINIETKGFGFNKNHHRRTSLSKSNTTPPSAKKQKRISSNINVTPSESRHRRSSVQSNVSPSSSIENMEITRWKHLPSSTMMENNISDRVTPNKLRKSTYTIRNDSDKEIDEIRRQRSTCFDIEDRGSDDELLFEKSEPTKRPRFTYTVEKIDDTGDDKEMHVEKPQSLRGSEIALEQNVENSNNSGNELEQIGAEIQTQENEKIIENVHEENPNADRSQTDIPDTDDIHIQNAKISLVIDKQVATEQVIIEEKDYNHIEIQYKDLLEKDLGSVNKGLEDHGLNGDQQEEELKQPGQDQKSQDYNMSDLSSNQELVKEIDESMQSLQEENQLIEEEEYDFVDYNTDEQESEIADVVEKETHVSKNIESVEQDENGEINKEKDLPMDQENEVLPPKQIDEAINVVDQQNDKHFDVVMQSIHQDANNQNQDAVNHDQDAVHIYQAAVDYEHADANHEQDVVIQNKANQDKAKSVSSEEIGPLALDSDTETAENEIVGDNMILSKHQSLRNSDNFIINSSEQSSKGSSWDSHRTMRKSLAYQTMHSPRKSLRTMVLAKSAKMRLTSEDVCEEKHMENEANNEVLFEDKHMENEANNEVLFEEKQMENVANNKIIIDNDNQNANTDYMLVTEAKNNYASKQKNTDFDDNNKMLMFANNDKNANDFSDKSYNDGRKLVDYDDSDLQNNLSYAENNQSKNENQKNLAESDVSTTEQTTDQQSYIENEQNDKDDDQNNIENDENSMELDLNDTDNNQSEIYNDKNDSGNDYNDDKNEQNDALNEQSNNLDDDNLVSDIDNGENASTDVDNNQSDEENVQSSPENAVDEQNTEIDEEILEIGADNAEIDEENVESEGDNAQSDVDNAPSDLENAQSDAEVDQSDAENVQSDVKNAQSDVGNAQTDVENTQSDVQNAQSDEENTQSDVENAQSDEENAQSDVENAQSDEENVQSDVEDAQSHLENDQSALSDVENNQNITNNDEIKSPYNSTPRTKAKIQSTLEAYMIKIKQQNIERNQKRIDAIKKMVTKKVVPDLNYNLKNTYNFKPSFASPKIYNPKPKVPPKKNKFKEILNKENIVQNKPKQYYKPKNQLWVNKRLYKYLESKLDSKYKLQARLKAEDLVHRMIDTIKELQKKANQRRNPERDRDISVLKKEMATCGVLKTHYDFFLFVKDYLPLDYQHLLVPDCFNGLKMPKDGIFSDIIQDNSIRV